MSMNIIFDIILIIIIILIILFNNNVKGIEGYLYFVE
jgi:hypothetical protein